MMIRFAGVMVLLITTWLSKGAEGVIGMNWGRVSSQRLVPSIVVDLMLQNGIRDVRVFTSQPDIMEAFAGSGINLAINAFWVNVIETQALCDKWVRDRNSYLSKANVRRIFIGSQVFKEGLNNNKTKMIASLASMELLMNSLDKAGFGGKIEVGMTHSSDILTSTTKPSESEFHPGIMDSMLRYLRFIKARNFPFLIEIFPIIYVMRNNIDPSFAYCDNKSTYVVRDLNGTLYTNAFDYLYDSFVWALRKVGAPDLEIIVAYVGWPTDGFPGANAPNAERFYKTFLPMVASNKGTPLRPGKPIDVFVQSLTDENRNPADYPHYRHWGIYRSNGEPKYKIDLSGQGRDIYPAKAKGIMRMPDRWCVFNRDTSNNEKLKIKFIEACQKADCTSLAPGGSCSQLDFYQNISYAFNMFFQSKFQDEDACDFDGLGQVVTSDPSEGTCVFPVEVVKGQQVNILLAADGERLYVHRIVVLVISILCIIL